MKMRYILISLTACDRNVFEGRCEFIVAILLYKYAETYLTTTCQHTPSRGEHAPGDWSHLLVGPASYTAVLV